MPLEVLSVKEAKRRLRSLGWKTFGKHKNYWYTTKKGLKRYTAHGLTFAEAASLEAICFDSRD